MITISLPHQPNSICSIHQHSQCPAMLMIMLSDSPPVNIFITLPSYHNIPTAIAIARTHKPHPALPNLDAEPALS